MLANGRPLAPTIPHNYVLAITILNVNLSVVQNFLPSISVLCYVYVTSHPPKNCTHLIWVSDAVSVSSLNSSFSWSELKCLATSWPASTTQDDKAFLCVWRWNIFSSMEPVCNGGNQPHFAQKQKKKREWCKVSQQVNDIWSNSSSGHHATREPWLGRR